MARQKKQNFKQKIQATKKTKQFGIKKIKSQKKWLTKKQSQKNG
jgi:hypothetical protein